MTDQPPTDDPGDVVVVGQRRSEPWQPFPERPTLVRPDPDVAVLPDEETGPLDPCFNPETALEWNADAAAAEALRRMQADANDPLLDGRERGIVIYRDPATQMIRLGNLAVGPAMGGAVTPDLTGINGGSIIGFIHSHPGSGPYPSGPDRTILFPFFQDTITSGGGNAALFRLYMVGTRADPGGPARLQIRVYKASNLSGDENNPGPEVNPDGEPCP